MIDECLRIGDEVVIIEGYNSFPNGTKAIVIGFSETYYGRIKNLGHKPGIYVNRGWAKLRLEDGREYTEWCGRFELTDKDESEKRLAEFLKQQRENPNNDLYRWTLNEVLAAIRNGIVHGFSMTSVLGIKASICAKRFRNEELVKRIATATLKVFEKRCRYSWLYPHLIHKDYFAIYLFKS